MAAIGISEFTFGYAFLYEQTHANWQNLRAFAHSTHRDQSVHAIVITGTTAS